jgi:hypothetical protein
MSYGPFTPEDDLQPFDCPVDWSSSWGEGWTVRYDQTADMLIYGQPRAFGINALHPTDDYVYVRVDDTTGAIVAFQVDNWSRVYLPRHPELAEAWIHVVRVPLNSRWDLLDQAWIARFDAYIRERTPAALPVG